MTLTISPRRPICRGDRRGGFCSRLERAGFVPATQAVSGLTPRWLVRAAAYLASTMSCRCCSRVDKLFRDASEISSMAILDW